MSQGQPGRQGQGSARGESGHARGAPSETLPHRKDFKRVRPCGKVLENALAPRGPNLRQFTGKCWPFLQCDLSWSERGLHITAEVINPSARDTEGSLGAQESHVPT